MKGTRRFLGPILVAAMALAAALPALASPVAQLTAPASTVIALQGSPHLWIADDQGVLHWGGDTRALADKSINWADTRTVSLDQLRSYRRGEPWLSAGLLKLGDPIYLVKWETTEAQPRLLHIQSIADVELFGIDGSNYGRFVLDQATWEQRYGFSAAALQRSTLASAVPATSTPTPAVTATPSPLKAREVSVELLDGQHVRNTIEITGAPAGKRLKVSATLVEWVCSPACELYRTDKWGPIETAPTDATGKLTFVDEHFTYKEYSYTFEDVNGNKVTISFKDDRSRFNLT